MKVFKHPAGPNVVMEEGDGMSVLLDTPDGNKVRLIWDEDQGALRIVLMGPRMPMMALFPLSNNVALMRGQSHIRPEPKHEDL